MSDRQKEENLYEPNVEANFKPFLRRKYHQSINDTACPGWYPLQTPEKSEFRDFQSPIVIMRFRYVKISN